MKNKHFGTTTTQNVGRKRSYGNFFVGLKSAVCGIPRTWSTSTSEATTYADTSLKECVMTV